jgi:hypothetical protein
MVRGADHPYTGGMRNAAVALDELVMGTLLPASPAADHDDKLVSIEIVDDDLVMTDRFARLSTPYERVDIEPIRESAIRIARPRTYATTVKVFDPAWFDKPAEVADEAPAVARPSWLWLALSILAAAAVVTVLLAM